MSKDTLRISREEWVKTATSEQCDAMTAMLLDYRFEGDNLISMWWKIFRELGFKHDGTKYELPESAPLSGIFEGNELYERLDQFAIPQLTSTFQEVSPIPEVVVTRKEDDIVVEWWRKLRDEMIFRRFHPAIEKIKAKPRKKGSRTKPTISSKVSQPKRKATTGSDSGAELFMKRQRKRSLKHKGTEDNEVDTQVIFPTVEEYTKVANYDLTGVGSREESYANNFGQWKFLCSTNQSLLFFGAGSKRTLLNRFADEELEKDGDVLIVDGFDKDVTIEGILDLIVCYWLEGKEPGHNRYDVHLRDFHDPLGAHFYPVRGDLSIVQRAVAIGQALAQSTVNTLRPLYLVLHNIDGVGLRNPTAQEALASLVSQSKTIMGLNSLRLIASVDHVNGPALLWDSLTCFRFSWIWKQVNTHRPYIEEVTESKISDSLPKLTQRKRSAENATEESVFAVLTSLAPRITEVLKELASLQLGMPTDQGERWVNYRDLLRQCRHAMCVSNDNQLRNFLGELIDHGIVERNEGSTPSYCVPYSNDKLEQIINYERE